MPVCLEPGLQLEVVLDSDESKPVDSRPAFLVRAQSARQTRKLGSLLDRLVDCETAEQLHDEVMSELQSVVIGWRNMGQTFTPDALWDVLHIQEAIQILRRVLWLSRPDVEEKKS